MAIVAVKTNPDNPPFYTDTDSVFLGKPLDPLFVGDDLGQFKDELKGTFITEALFLAPKMYGFKTPLFEKVVIAGVSPNSVSYEELIKIWEGETIFKERQSLSKSFTDMSISSNTTKLALRLDTKEITKTPIYNKEGRLLSFRPPKIGL